MIDNIFLMIFCFSLLFVPIIEEFLDCLKQFGLWETVMSFIHIYLIFYG